MCCALGQMVCVHVAVGVEAPLGSCLLLRQERSWRSTRDDFGHLMEGPKALVWCVDNAGATFVVCSPEQGSPPGARGAASPVLYGVTISARHCLLEASMKSKCGCTAPAWDSHAM